MIHYSLDSLSLLVLQEDQQQEVEGEDEGEGEVGINGPEDWRRTKAETSRYQTLEASCVLRVCSSLIRR